MKLFDTIRSSLASGVSERGLDALATFGSELAAKAQAKPATGAAVVSEPSAPESRWGVPISFAALGVLAIFGAVITRDAQIESSMQEAVLQAFKAGDNKRALDLIQLQWGEFLRKRAYHESRRDKALSEDAYQGVLAERVLPKIQEIVSQVEQGQQIKPLRNVLAGEIRSEVSEQIRKRSFVHLEERERGPKFERDPETGQLIPRVPEPVKDPRTGEVLLVASRRPELVDGKTVAYIVEWRHPVTGQTDPRFRPARYPFKADPRLSAAQEERTRLEDEPKAVTPETVVEAERILREQVGLPPDMTLGELAGDESEVGKLVTVAEVLSGDDDLRIAEDLSKRTGVQAGRILPKLRQIKKKAAGELDELKARVQKAKTVEVDPKQEKTPTISPKLIEHQKRFWLKISNLIALRDKEKAKGNQEAASKIASEIQWLRQANAASMPPKITQEQYTLATRLAKQDLLVGEPKRRAKEWQDLYQERFRQGAPPEELQRIRDRLLKLGAPIPVFQRQVVPVLVGQVQRRELPELEAARAKQMQEDVAGWEKKLQKASDQASRAKGKIEAFEQVHGRPPEKQPVFGKSSFPHEVKLWKDLSQAENEVLRARERLEKLRKG